MSEFLRGVGVALVTPFKDSGEVDLETLDKLIDYVIEGGVDYVVALGTTAETPTLTVVERNTVFKRIKTTINGRVPIVIGIGGNCTTSIIKDFGNFDMTGVEAILSVTPYYNKPSQEGLCRHYSALAEIAPRPLILYNVPSRTGVNLAPETVLRLAGEHDNIIALKEACGDVAQFDTLLEKRPKGFIVLSGDDAMTLPLIKRGGDGVISVAANVFPSQINNVTKSALNGDFDKANSGWSEISELTAMMFEEGNPTGVKAAMAIKGLISNNLRLPLIPSSEGLYERMRTLMESKRLE